MDKTPRDEDLRKLLNQVCKRNPDYLAQLKNMVTRLVTSLPAWQWCGRKEWDVDKVDEIFGIVFDRLFKGNLIRFWLSAKTDSCVLKTNLNNLVFNLVYSKAPKTGKLFHTHVADQLCNDPEFVKESFARNKNNRQIMRIGLASWKHRNQCPLADDQLMDLWRKNVKLPQYTNAHKLRPAQRAEIFRLMLETANGWVKAKDFYRGYIIITGFTFNSVDSLEEQADKDADNSSSNNSGYFSFLQTCASGSPADEREKIRQSIVESYDSWQPYICSILKESPETSEFLRCYFLEVGRNKSEAAARVNRSPTWATNTMNDFFNKVTAGIAFKETVEEYDKKAFVQLIIHQLAAYQPGEQRS